MVIGSGENIRKYGHHNMLVSVILATKKYCYQNHKVSKGWYHNTHKYKLSDSTGGQKNKCLLGIEDDISLRLQVLEYIPRIKYIFRTWILNG